MRFSLFFLCVLCGFATQISSVNFAGAPAQKQTAHRVNELTLAGIRPGRDTLAAAQKKLPAGLSEQSGQSGSAHSWIDECAKRRLSVEVDDAGLAQNIDIEAAKPDGNFTCGSQTAPDRFWATGHGLRLGDPLQRVIAIYGQPGSRGPSVKNGRELELLYYAFDWAGPEVPQVMEVSCERSTGRVVEILLAAPSL
jgi:hypothetical protein